MQYPVLLRAAHATTPHCRRAASPQYESLREKYTRAIQQGKDKDEEIEGLRDRYVHCHRCASVRTVHCNLMPS